MPTYLRRFRPDPNRQPDPGIPGGGGPVYEALAVDIQALPDGAVAANSLGGGLLAHEAASASSQTAYGSNARTLWHPSGTGALVARSVRTDLRDVTVDGWAAEGALYGRVTASGRAIRLDIDLATSTLTIEVVTGATNPSTSQVETLLDVVDLENLAGFDAAATDGHRARLVLDGVRIEAYYDVGTGLYQRVAELPYDGWLHALPGYVAWGAGQNGDGLRALGYRERQPVELGSDPQAGIWEASDFGVRELRTTCSATSGSNDIVLATAAHGLEPGDFVIVGVGGEASLQGVPESGGGVIGPRKHVLNATEGVGGVWPPPERTVATVADLPPSDSFQTFWFVEDEQINYNHVPLGSGVSEWRPEDYWYVMWRIPLAHRSEVTRVQGATVTLREPVQATVTDAEVVLDTKQAYFWEHVYEPRAGAPSITKLTLAEGRYGFWGRISLTPPAGTVLEGEGKLTTLLYAPLGAAYPHLFIQGSPDSQIRHMGAICNFRQDGGWHTEDVRITAGEQSHRRPFRFQSASRCEGQDLYVEYPSVGYGGENGDDIWFRRCFALAAGNLSYTQWMGQSSGVTGGGFEDFVVKGDTYCHAFEPFNMTRGTFRRITGLNTKGSSNSSEETLYEDLYIQLEAGIQTLRGDALTGDPLLQVNGSAFGFNNVGGEADIRRYVVCEEGPIWEGGTAPGDLASVFRLNFQRTFQATSTADWRDVNVSDVVRWIPPAFRSQSAGSCVMLKGNPDSFHSVRRVRDYALNPDRGGNTVLFEESDTTGVIEDCVGVAFNAQDGTTSGNQSLADWQAATDRSQGPTAGFRYENARGTGYMECWAYDVDETDPQNPLLVPLSTSSWGEIIRYAWTVRDDQGAVVHEDKTRVMWALLGPGTYDVELTVWDEDEQTDTITQTVTVT